MAGLHLGKIKLVVPVNRELTEQDLKLRFTREIGPITTDPDSKSKTSIWNQPTKAPGRRRIEGGLLKNLVPTNNRPSIHVHFLHVESNVVSEEIRLAGGKKDFVPLTHLELAALADLLSQMDKPPGELIYEDTVPSDDSDTTTSVKRVKMIVAAGSEWTMEGEAEGIIRADPAIFNFGKRWFTSLVPIKDKRPWVGACVFAITSTRKKDDG